MPSENSLILCQSGFEGLLARELESLGSAVESSGPGWCLAAAVPQAPRSAAFAHRVLEQAETVAGDRVNDLAQQVMEVFSASLKGERIEGPWPCIFTGGQDTPGLNRRVASVEDAFMELLRKKLGRLAKLASADVPRLGPSRGLFVAFTDFGCARVSRSAYSCGPCRMADDVNAPSRSYLKIEEAYGVIGSEPLPGETVCDLGAAPGGWSYSAAKRGANVVAVDNGPLKAGALNNPRIDHRQDDAFGFSPGREKTYDWMLADLVEDPRKVMALIVRPWLEGRWCKRFVVNLKFGRVDPIELLRELRAEDGPLARHAASVRIIHLFHDREELTVTGSVTS